jgi:hypothetical protein
MASGRIISSVFLRIEWGSFNLLTCFSFFATKILHDAEPSIKVIDSVPLLISCRCRAQQWHMTGFLVWGYCGWPRQKLYQQFQKRQPHILVYTFVWPWQALRRCKQKVILTVSASCSVVRRTPWRRGAVSRVLNTQEENLMRRKHFAGVSISEG